MDSDRKFELILFTLLIIAMFGLGFWLGRATTKEKTEIVTEYIQGETIHDTITKPKPYAVIRPIDTAGIIQQCVRDGIYWELFPEKIVTQYVEVTREDTTGIMADWATKRLYRENLFSIDSLGSCTVNFDVQYNRMSNLSYEYTPVQKVITKTVYTTKKLSPFIGIGVMANPWDKEIIPMGSLSGGLFFKERVGIQIQYQHAFGIKKEFLGGNILYKF